MIIGITGETGSGKTTIAEYLKQLLFIYINVDEIGRQVVEPGKPAYLSIVSYFGAGILNDDKTINRKKLGDIVFSDLQLLSRLNEMTHKNIFNEVSKLLQFYKKEYSDRNIIIDAAPLFEIGLDALCDTIWFVEADKEARLKRIMERSKLQYEDAVIRVNSQNYFENKKKCDRIIYNNGDINETLMQVHQIIGM